MGLPKDPDDPHDIDPYYVGCGTDMADDDVDTYTSDTKADDDDDHVDGDHDGDDHDGDDDDEAMVGSS